MNDLEENRNEVFASLDRDRIISFCKKREIEIPENEEAFWAGVHKVICSIFLSKDSIIDEKQYKNSYNWLVRHGFKTIEDDNYEQEEPEENLLPEDTNEIVKSNEEYEEKTKKILSIEEKLNLMIEYINETGKKIDTKTKYKGYNIGHLRNNLRQMYYNGTLNIEYELLEKFLKYGIIKEKKERIRTSQQEKYEFLIALVDKSEAVKEKAKMKNGLTYNEVKKQIQVEYNRNSIKLTDEQIDNLRKKHILGYSKEEIKEIEYNFGMPKKYALDIINNYATIYEFKEAYKKCKCNYDFKNDIFCGFRGITVSKNDISEYQKLQYALAIKDILSIDFNQIEYNTGKYLDLEQFEKMFMTIPERSGMIYKLYHAFDGKKYSYAELAKLFKISGSRIGTILDETERRLKHPSRSKYLIRDCQNDYREIDDYNIQIKILKSEIEDLQIIKDYLLNEDNNNDNIETSRFMINNDKIAKLNNNKTVNMQNLMQKYYNEARVSLKDKKIYELDLSVRTFNRLNLARIKTLYDLISLTETEVMKIRALGENSYNEIVDKLSSMGLKLRKNNEEKNSNIPVFLDESFNNFENTVNYFMNLQREKTEKLKIIIERRDYVKNRIIKYYKAIEQYLNNEDIFDKEYIVAGINLNKDDLKNFDKIKNALKELKIIKNDIEN